MDYENNVKNYINFMVIAVKMDYQRLTFRRNRTRNSFETSIARNIHCLPYETSLKGNAKDRYCWGSAGAAGTCKFIQKSYRIEFTLIVERE